MADIGFYHHRIKMNKIGKHHYTVYRHIIGYIMGIGIFMVLIPYVIWYLSSIGHPIFSTPIFPSNYANIIAAIPLFTIGIMFVIWSNIFLVLKGRGGPVDIGEMSISPRTEKLVTEGPYKYTRNPMIFGTNSIYISIAVYLNSLGCLIVAIIFFVFIIKTAVVSEENRLQKDFGDEYTKYREQTSMIVPLPVKHKARDRQ